jgi:hypothetical protein
LSGSIALSCLPADPFHEIIWYVIANLAIQNGFPPIHSVNNYPILQISATIVKSVLPVLAVRRAHNRLPLFAVFARVFALPGKVQVNTQAPDTKNPAIAGLFKD